MNFLLWLVYFIPAILIELVCYLLAPLVAIFITTRWYDDIVKRKGKIMIALRRDFIIKPLYWFQTHDNAVDEWWYGVYNKDHWFKFAQNWTQNDYDNSKFIRYYCRLMWLWRNCAYGFHYNLFSRPKETVIKRQFLSNNIPTGKVFWYCLSIYPKSFQFECHIPLKWRYISINIGWKAHKKIPNLLYANRIISFKKI